MYFQPVPPPTSSHLLPLPKRGEMEKNPQFRYVARRSRATWKHSRREVVLACTAFCLFITFGLGYKFFMRPTTRGVLYRDSDTTDIFAHWKGREKCDFGSMDLHVPFEPLCTNRASLLSSMTDGGRPGFDAPYYPRGCDLHFYHSDDICRILTRYEAIIVFGDSLMRHLTSTFSMLLREDMQSGGQEQWLQDEQAIKSGSCQCDEQVQLFFCHKSDVLSLRDIYENDSSSVKCGFLDRPEINFKPLTTWPLDPGTLDRDINLTIKEEKPSKPYAFIFGHGLWNELHEYESIAWVDQIQERIRQLRPYFDDDDVFWPRIFVAPNAAGENKQDGFILTQGNKQIVKFEKFMRANVPSRGVEFLGTYNMSVQATIPDGTHSGIKVNLLKAMTIVNWLDMLDVSDWSK